MANICPPKSSFQLDFFFATSTKIIAICIFLSVQFGLKTLLRVWNWHFATATLFGVWFWEGLRWHHPPPFWEKVIKSTAYFYWWFFLSTTIQRSQVSLVNQSIEKLEMISYHLHLSAVEPRLAEGAGVQEGAENEQKFSSKLPFSSCPRLSILLQMLEEKMPRALANLVVASFTIFSILHRRPPPLTICQQTILIQTSGFVGFLFSDSTSVRWDGTKMGPDTTALVENPLSHYSSPNPL